MINQFEIRIDLLINFHILHPIQEMTDILHNPSLHHISLRLTHHKVQSLEYSIYQIILTNTTSTFHLHMKTHLQHQQDCVEQDKKIGTVVTQAISVERVKGIVMMM